MKARWFWCVAIAQVALLVFMAGEREWVLHTGRTVVVHAEPVDPTDPMRGAYVRLAHRLSEVPKALCSDDLAGWFAERDDVWRYRESLRDRVVYAGLRIDDRGAAQLVSLSASRPESGLFVRGRVDLVEADFIRVRYGIEALFMEKRRAQQLEESMAKDKAGVPLELEVAVSPRGIAVVRGHQWAPLGLTFSWVRPPSEEKSSRRPQPTGALVRFKNHSDRPLAIVDRPGGRSLRLMSERRWGFDNDHWVGERTPVPPASPDDVVVLQPGQVREIAVDLTAPEWWVLHKENSNSEAVPTSLSKVDDFTNIWFRFEYVPPTKAEAAGLPHAELIRHGDLRSPRLSTYTD